MVYGGGGREGILVYSVLSKLVWICVRLGHDGREPPRNRLQLVREAKLHAKGRVHVALPLLVADKLGRVVVQHLEVFGVELDEILVGRDPLRGDRLGEDRVPAGDYAVPSSAPHISGVK